MRIYDNGQHATPRFPNRIDLFLILFFIFRSSIKFLMNLRRDNCTPRCRFFGVNRNLNQYAGEVNNRRNWHGFNILKHDFTNTAARTYKLNLMRWADKIDIGIAQARGICGGPSTWLCQDSARHQEGSQPSDPAVIGTGAWECGTSR